MSIPPADPHGRLPARQPTRSRAPTALQSGAATAGPWLALSIHGIVCSAAVGGDGRRAVPGDRTGVASDPRPVSRLALRVIDDVLADAGLTPASLSGCCYARGPGAFTALRVTASLVQGLAYARGLPIIGVSTLATLAASAAHGAGGVAGRIALVAIDARMGECYFGAYWVACAPVGRPIALIEPALGAADAAIGAFDAVLAHPASAAFAGVDLGGSAWLAAGDGFEGLATLGRWLDARGRSSRMAGATLATADAVLAAALGPAGAFDGRFAQAWPHWDCDRPMHGAAADALPLYLRDKVALDVDEQQALADARVQARADARPPADTGRTDPHRPGTLR